MTIMETEQATTVLPEIDTTEGTWQMDPSLKQRWVTALRSGKYRQTTGTFYRPEANAHCALGVLFDVAGQPYLVDGIGNWDYLYDAIGSEAKTEAVWTKNDRGRATFPELADYIEENL